MRIRLIWVGRTRDAWLSEGIEKYLKLLRPYAKVEVVEIKGAGGRVSVEKAVSEEGRRIMDKAQDGYVLLDEKGKNYGSREFASRFLEGRASVDFVLGGPWGVSEEVKQGARADLSLSKMTLTHEMARVVLLEQVYRGFTIITGREYHH